MPQCKKCQEFFPPNYTEIIPDRQPNEKGEYPQHCIFCKLGVEEVEREESPNSDRFVKYTKEECIRDYKAFVAKFKDVAGRKAINKTLKDNPFGLR